MGRKKATRKYLPDDIKTKIMDHIVDMDTRAEENVLDDLKGLLVFGCPGLKNMSDDELITSLFENWPFA